MKHQEFDSSPFTFLASKLTRLFRQNAAQYWKDHKYAIRDIRCMSENWAFLWFRTAGCFQERAGSCLMCKYGSGPEIEHEEIIDCFHEGLKKINQDYDLLFASAAGSMLDQREVTSKTLKIILNSLAKTNHKGFAFETRCETVTDDSIKICLSILNKRLRFIFMGLEVSDENILKYCLNKNQSLLKFQNALETMNRFQVGSSVNVLIGIPFFSVNERIKIAIDTIRWALSHQAEYCFLFPINIKEHTPLASLFEENRYEPPSLWELVEILIQFPQAITAKKIGISWYKPQKGAPGILHSPTTCPKCHRDVLDILDRYDQDPNMDLIALLQNYECDCRYDWYDKIAMSNKNNFTIERMIDAYGKLFDQFDGTRILYQDNCKIIHKELIKNLSDYEGRYQYDGRL